MTNASLVTNTSLVNNAWTPDYFPQPTNTNPTHMLPPDEQGEVLGIFMAMLRLPTTDGGNKRAAGTKVNWKIDTEHKAAAWRHLDPARERYDETSGAHKNIHAAWRLLADAYQDMVRDGKVQQNP